MNNRAAWLHVRKKDSLITNELAVPIMNRVVINFSYIAWMSNKKNGIAMFKNPSDSSSTFISRRLNEFSESPAVIFSNASGMRHPNIAVRIDHQRIHNIAQKTIERSVHTELPSIKPG